MKIKNSALTNIGKVRELNEDYFLIKDDNFKLTLKYGKLYIVCDGMGGHQAGEIASKIAAEEFLKNYYSEELKEADIVKRIRISIELTNKKIFYIAKNNPSVQGMGTTIVGLIVKSKKAFVFNVGDSRCYLIRKDKIEQFTEDHSLVNELVKAKIMNEEDAKTSSKRNVLTRAIGTDEKVEPFIREINPTSGNKFLLCTDGLSNMVKENEIKHIVSENEPKNAVEKLVALANERGGPDNITAIEVAIESRTNTKVLITSIIALLIVLFAIVIIQNILFSKILVETNPKSASISFNGNTFEGECVLRIRKNHSIELLVNKDGYKEEKIDIYKNDSRLAYRIGDIEGEINNHKLLVNLEKLINFKFIDESSGMEVSNAILKIDDGKTIEDLSNAYPLTLGKHKIEVSHDMYYPVSSEIDINENSDSITLELAPIPKFTLDSEPQGAYIQVYNDISNKFEYLKDNSNSPLTSPCEIDFNMIKGRKVILLIDVDTIHVYYNELKISDESEIPANKIKLKKCTRLNVVCDLANAKLYDYFGEKELVKIDENTFLIPREITSWFHLMGNGSYNNYSVQVEKTFNISKIGNKMQFTFKILNFSDDSVELAGISYFNGVINDEIPITLDASKKNFDITNIKINKISGTDNNGFQYTFTREEQ